MSEPKVNFLCPQSNISCERTDGKETRRPEFHVWGILGGIACGKSLVSDFFRDCGIPVFDADRMGHQLYEKPEIQNVLLERWGTKILKPDGSFDRKKIAEIVFGTENQTANPEELAFLNALFHPAIHREWQNFREEARAAGKKMVILDAALLLESGWKDECGELLFVDTPRERQIAFARARGWTLEELEAREKKQFPLEKKRAEATILLPNAGTKEELERRLTKILKERTGLEF